MKRLSIVLVLLLAFAIPARAQLQGGSISGTVSDEQGAILPGVTITLKGVDATQEVNDRRQRTVSVSQPCPRTVFSDRNTAGVHHARS